MRYRLKKQFFKQSIQRGVIMNRIYQRMLIMAVMFGLCFTGCASTEPTQQKCKKAKIAFYTNAQAIVNCGQFDVNIYTDSILVGTISYPIYAENIDSILVNLDCIYLEQNEHHNIVIERECGTTIEYHAKSTRCGFEWNGQIKIEKDSCYNIFLDGFFPMNILTNKENI